MRTRLKKPIQIIFATDVCASNRSADSFCTANVTQPSYARKKHACDDCLLYHVSAVEVTGVKVTENLKTKHPFFFLIGDLMGLSNKFSTYAKYYLGSLHNANN